MFLKNKVNFLFIPAVFLNVLFILSFILIYAKTLDSNENIYLTLIKSSDFLASLLYGFKISFFVLALSIALYMSIYYMLFLLKFKYKQDLKIWFISISIPILIPYSFCAFLMFLMFFPVGLLKEFMPFLVGTTLGVVIAYTYKIVPFLILISFPNLLKISKNEINLHKIYSSKSFDFFWYILIKRNLSVMFIGLFVVFSYVFNAYEIPSILGSNIDKMPAVYVSEILNEYNPNALSIGYASSLLFFCATLLCINLFFLVYKFLKRNAF